MMGSLACCKTTEAAGVACLADQVSPQGRQAIKVDLLQQLCCGCAVPDPIALQCQGAMVSLAVCKPPRLQCLDHACLAESTSYIAGCSKAGMWQHAGSRRDRCGAA